MNADRHRARPARARGDRHRRGRASPHTPTARSARCTRSPTPGNALTRTTRDAFGRVRQLDDPDRGTTTSTHDGFGELISSTDALGRVVTFEYDALGRTLSRLDQHGAESLDDHLDLGHGGARRSASSPALASPDGEKTYTYTRLGQLETLTLAVHGESTALAGDARLRRRRAASQTITYPSAGRGAPFVVAQDYDAYGHVLTVRDDATNARLLAAHGRGRRGPLQSGGVRQRCLHDAELLPRQAEPPEHRHHRAARRRCRTCPTTTTRGCDLTSRTDALQPQNQTERFRYDALERLTCAYFSAAEDDAAPCALALRLRSQRNGNLISKSDVGTLAYGDPQAPARRHQRGERRVRLRRGRQPDDAPGRRDADLHALRSAEDHHAEHERDHVRVRRRRAADPQDHARREETLYFGDLYERVTTVAPGADGAPVLRPLARAGGRGRHARAGRSRGRSTCTSDHLGSVDVLTDESGAVVERRSYDPFGQRRNPVWGQPPPASFSSLTTRGVHRARERRRARAREHEGADLRPEGRAVLDDGPDRVGAALGAELEPVQLRAQQPAEPRGSERVRGTDGVSNAEWVEFPKVRIPAGPQERHPRLSPGQAGVRCRVKQAAERSEGRHGRSTSARPEARPGTCRNR